jgi:hypothetical protein
MITVLVCYERISLFHTMEPFFRKRFKKLFRFTQSAGFCLKKDKNKILLMERQFQSRTPKDLSEEDIDLMKGLRDKYKTIVFLNGQPEAGTNRLDLMPYVDRLFYKSIFADVANYKKDLYGKNLFADYYHKNYGIDDPDGGYHYNPPVEADSGRVELSWNIGVGGYPRWHQRQRLGTIAARANFPRLGRLLRTHPSAAPPDFSGDNRSIAVHARIDPVSCPSIAYQRKLFLEKIKGLPGFLTGLVEQARYYSELYDSKMVLSPFGWGEVCFRDFEAIVSGSLLLKPDMSHLKTWPDVYIPYETYVPLKWDGSDIQEKSEAYLANGGERMRIARNAWEEYNSALDKLEDRFSALFQDIL